MHNHLESNYHLHNKKALFYNMMKFYQTEGVEPAIPVTFHVQNGLRDKEFLRFKEYYLSQEQEQQQQQQAMSQSCDSATSSSGYYEVDAHYWIVKPGEFTNRGRGIEVCANMEEVRECVR